jgi:hypothetical protein
MSEKFTVTSHNDRFAIRYRNQFNRFHREDGPAIYYHYGNDFGRFLYAYDGKDHRIGGPSYFGGVNHPSRYYWYKYGDLHRLNAPAHLNDSNKEWWEFGVKIK